MLKTYLTHLWNYKAYDGELNIGLDCWTSPNHHPWMSIVISCLRKDDDGKEVIMAHLLDFVELPCSHSGQNMAECLACILKEYGIESKVSEVVYKM
jgi:hypothetical protein